MYHYRESGLRNIWLVNGFETHKTPYGEGISIRDIEGLHKAIGKGLVRKSGKLTGSELRFLRQNMSLSQTKLAHLLGNEAQTIALWEKNGKQPKIADRFIRAIYREIEEGNAHISEMIERLVDSDLAEYSEKITLQQDKTGWKLAA